MINNFSYFTFSIFSRCSFLAFTEAVTNSEFHGGLLQRGKALLKYHDQLCLNDYINPETGSVLERFSWWTSALYPNRVFLSSNRADGLQTGCYSFQKQLNCPYVNISISTDKCLYPKNHFECVSIDNKERVVLALKEDRWTFFQQGEPLPFETMDYYNNRRIKDRMNFAIIKEYLLKMGIDFYKIDSLVNDCTTYIRTDWGK